MHTHFYMCKFIKVLKLVCVFNSYLNSTSTRLNSFKSALSSKALRIGSSSVNMIKAGLAKHR